MHLHGRWFKVHFDTLLWLQEMLNVLIVTNVAIAVTDFDAIKALVIEKTSKWLLWARRPIVKGIFFLE
jgi:hypothetical protein